MSTKTDLLVFTSSPNDICNAAFYIQLHNKILIFSIINEPTSPGLEHK